MLVNYVTRTLTNYAQNISLAALTSYWNRCWKFHYFSRKLSAVFE